MHVLRVMDVASRCGVHIQTLYRIIKRDASFPRSFQLGRSRVWDEEDIENWLRKQKEMDHGSEIEERDQRADVRPADCPAE